MMLKIVALALVLSVVSGAAGGGSIDAHLDDEDVDDVDDGSVEEQATKLMSLLQVENGDRQALRGGLALKLGGGKPSKKKKGKKTGKGGAGMLSQTGMFTLSSGHQSGTP